MMYRYQLNNGELVTGLEGLVKALHNSKTAKVVAKWRPKGNRVLDNPVWYAHIWALKETGRL